jgi:hypothetical protein
MVGKLPVFYPGERAEEVLRFYREFVKDVPDELTTLVNLLTALPAPFIPEEWHGKKLAALIGCYAGDVEAGAKAMAPLRSWAAQSPTWSAMPYVLLTDLGDPHPALRRRRPGARGGDRLRRARPHWCPTPSRSPTSRGLPLTSSGRSASTRTSSPP